MWEIINHLIDHPDFTHTAGNTISDRLLEPLKKKWKQTVGCRKDTYGERLQSEPDTNICRISVIVSLDGINWA